MLNWFARRMQELQKAKRDEQGFTLIELLVVRDHHRDTGGDSHSDVLESEDECPERFGGERSQERCSGLHCLLLRQQR